MSASLLAFIGAVRRCLVTVEVCPETRTLLAVVELAGGDLAALAPVVRFFCGVVEPERLIAASSAPR